MLFRPSGNHWASSSAHLPSFWPLFLPLIRKHPTHLKTLFEVKLLRTSLLKSILQKSYWPHSYRPHSNFLFFLWAQWWMGFWVRTRFCQQHSNQGRPTVDFLCDLRNRPQLTLRWNSKVFNWWRTSDTLWNEDWIFPVWVDLNFLCWDVWSRRLWDALVFPSRLIFSEWDRRHSYRVWIECRWWIWCLMFRNRGWVPSFRWFIRRWCWSSLRRWAASCTNLPSFSAFKISE